MSEASFSDDKQEVINLKVISRTNGEAFRSQCKSILFTSQSGQMQVLANHIPVLANIEANTQITVIDSENQTTTLNIASKGFFTFNHNQCLITLDEYSNATQNNQQNIKKAS